MVKSQKEWDAQKTYFGMNDAELCERLRMFEHTCILRLDRFQLDLLSNMLEHQKSSFGAETKQRAMGIQSQIQDEIKRYIDHT